MMAVGLHQHAMTAGGNTPPAWMVGGHAHLGVLSILAIVMGFAVPALDVTGTLRTAVTGLYVVGQWMLPISVWAGVGFGVTILLPAAFLWGLFLIVAMLIMAYHAATNAAVGSDRGPSATVPADD